MAIREVTQWVTTGGTVCTTLAEAQELEVSELVVDTLKGYFNWRDERFEDERFISFLKTDADAVAFVDALLDVYSHNPHILKESNDDLAT